MRQPLAAIGLGVQRDIGPSGRVRPARPAFRVFVHFAQFFDCCFVHYAHRQDPKMPLCNLHKGSHRPPQKFVQFAHLTNRLKCGIIKVQKGEQPPNRKEGTPHVVRYPLDRLGDRFDYRRFCLGDHQTGERLGARCPAQASNPKVHAENRSPRLTKICPLRLIDRNGHFVFIATNNSNKII